VKRERVEETLPVPYGVDASFTTAQYTCATCGESGDFTGENDAIVEAAMKKSIDESVVKMFDGLAAMGISLAYFERALRLPARTTARWKVGGLSAAPLALLRAVWTFPWLLNVAVSGFDRSAANSELVRAAADLLLSKLRERVDSVQVGVAASAGIVNVRAEFQLRDANAGSIQTSSSGWEIAKPEPALEYIAEKPGEC